MKQKGGNLKMSFGIALAGGGVRGTAHVGVLAALEEAGLCPSSVAGASAGSIAAGLLGSGMKAEEMKAVVYDLEQNGKYLVDVDIKGILKCIPNTLLKREFNLTGLIKGNRLEKYLWRLTEGKNIINADRRIVIPAVDLISGQTIAYTNSREGLKPLEMVRWETEGTFAEVMRASSAVPAIFQPKEMGCCCLVDGGVTNVLPVDLLIATGEKNVIAVDIGGRYKMPEKKNIFEVASHSFNIMSSCLKELTSQGERLLLKPPLPDYAGLLTFEYAVECMQAGYDYTKNLIPVIQKVFIHTDKERQIKQ